MTNSKKLRLNVTYGLKLIVVIVALACCGYAHSLVKSAPPPTRDWTLYPAVVEIDRPPGYIFAVSDPHAHFQRLQSLLLKAGLLQLTISSGEEAEVHWLGGNAVLVVTGDLIDKLPTGSLKIINLLRALQTDAARQGGQVIVTMGNHEAEFLSKKEEFKKKTKEFRDELLAASQNNPDLNPDRVANCEGDLGQWLCQLPMAARVGEWFFCHAGYTEGRSIETINKNIADDFILNNNGFKTQQLIGLQSILEAGLDQTGPGKKPWVFVGQPQTAPEELLKNYTKALGVRHIVQGHKPGNVPELNRTRGEMFQAYGLLFLIDTDMGASTDDSKDAVLRINVTGMGMHNAADPKPPCVTITTHAIAIKTDGSQKVLWEEAVRKVAYSLEPCK